MDNSNRTHGLWAVTAPAKPDLPVLREDRNVDTAVIGGGYTGLSAGMHLAKAGKESIVLDADEIGHGGAGRNVGLVNAGLWLMPEDVIKLVGPENGEKLIHSLGESPALVYDIIDRYGIECEALRNGTLHCAPTKKGLRALQQREAQWLTLGAPVRLLDREETAAKTGSRAFYGSLLDDRAGTLQPLAYTRGLARAALKEGSELYEKSPVTGLKKRKGYWQLTTPGGTVTVKNVIIAVHGYADHVFRHYHKNMVPFNFFQFATEPLAENIRETVLPERRGAWDTNLLLSSFRRDTSGRLVVGSVGMAEGFARGLNKKWVKRTLAKIFPQAADAKLQYGWHGRIAMTPDHIPKFHVLDKHMAAVTSYNGRGIGPGTLFGKLLADYITSGNPEEIPLPVSRIKPIGFRLLRGLFYESGARLYHFFHRRL